MELLLGKLRNMTGLRCKVRRIPAYDIVK